MSETSDRPVAKRGKSITIKKSKDKDYTLDSRGYAIRKSSREEREKSF